MTNRSLQILTQVLVSGIKQKRNSKKKENILKMETKTIFMVFSLLTVFLSFSYPTLAIENEYDKMLLEMFGGFLANWPSPNNYNFNVIRKIPPRHLGYLIKCSVKMGPRSDKCNVEVRDEILRNKSTSKDCCQMTMKAGKECHMEWMKIFFQFYQLKDLSSESNIKSNEIWNRCSTDVEDISPFSG